MSFQKKRTSVAQAYYIEKLIVTVHWHAYSRYISEVLGPLVMP